MAVNEAKIKDNGGCSEAEQCSSSGVDDDLGRAKWGGKLEFILACVGYAVGLGNVWRFPYLCYKNGGGAFLIPYFGTLAIIGLPLFFLELSLGQFASLGPIALWTLNPMFKGLGYLMVITNTMIGIYYNVIIAWIIYYLFASMNSVVPWQNCGNSWNSKYCMTAEMVKNITGNFTIVNNETIYRSDFKTPPEEYFYNKVLQMSGGVEQSGTVDWKLALCLLLAWLTVFLVLIKGISSLGKVVYFSSLFPYVLLTVMLVKGVTLSGAVEGILFYLKPDFSRLADARVWSDAATQIFFSLSTCNGGLIAMASYNNFRNNCLRDSILVPLINCMTSFYAGFAIFSVLGYMAEQKGVSVRDVAASGPGLVFVVYPEGLSTMPIAPLWSVLFFIMMLTLGFSSEFSIVECFFSSVIDEFEFVRRTKRRTIVFRAAGCVFFYLIGLSMMTNSGFYLFNIFDFYVGGFPLLVGGLLECLAVMYIYGYNRFADDIEMMLDKRPALYFRICWMGLAPASLLAIIVFMAVQYSPPTLFSDAYTYPLLGELIGWAITFICVFMFPVFFVVNFCRYGGWQFLLDAIKPTSKWGPSNPKYRTGRYAQSGGFDSVFDMSSSGYVNRAMTNDDSSNDNTLELASIPKAPPCNGITFARQDKINENLNSSRTVKDSSYENDLRM